LKYTGFLNQGERQIKKKRSMAFSYISREAG